MLKFRWFQDPGHAWLRVPLDFLQSTAFRPSSYSYVSENERYVYLEEDADAPAFLGYLKQNAIPYVVTGETYSKRPSRIRLLKPYRPVYQESCSSTPLVSC